MKSRYEVLKSSAERRQFAVVRSSGAIGVALAFAMGSLLATSPSNREPVRADLFALEIDDGAPAHPAYGESITTPAAPGAVHRSDAEASTRASQRPHFERSDEPVYEDSVRTYGG